jgi:hypothetical protein
MYHRCIYSSSSDSRLATFNTKQTIIELNGVRIIAIPSDHLDDARGIPNVSFFYSDETSFYSNKEQDNLIDISHRYILKSNPWMVFVSTPNKDGFCNGSIIGFKRVI